MMKSKIALTVATVVLLCLLVHAYWCISVLQEKAAFQAKSIKEMAAAHARADLLQGSSSYFLTGAIPRVYFEAFNEYFKKYGVQAVHFSMVTEVEETYTQDYNRVVRQQLKAEHGKDLIDEFNTYYRKRYTNRRN